MKEFKVEELLGPLNEVERRNAPQTLFVEGDTKLLKLPKVSIVGSRKASSEGVLRAKALALELVKRGTVVVSGLAEGIDTVAHQAAIDAGGKTVAVLGTPLDESFPAKNKALQDRIQREQLAVSQFPSGYPSRRENFPMRNRTMALLSEATVIVEAGEKSGSLHQGWEALRLGRPLFLMESILHKGFKWTDEMRHYGAEVLSRENLELLFELLPEGSRDERASVTF